METLLSLSKEERIARRRNRIIEKLNTSKELSGNGKSSHEISTQNDEESQNTTVEILSNDTKNYSIIKKNVDDKKEDLMNELSNEIKKETKTFLEIIKQFEIHDDSISLESSEQQDSNQIGTSVTNLNKFDSKNHLVEINNLALKEKETYRKKIEKYFVLLQYRDNRIQEVCQIHSENFMSLINLMKDQIEGYKIYLEGIYNRTRDELIMKRKQLLSNNKRVLEDFIKLQHLNTYQVATEIMEDEDQLNEKIQRQHNKNSISIELKSDLLKKKLSSNIDFIKNISSIIIDKEKNIYDGKMLMQKNNYNLKMINFYKLEINKLREALLSVKTHYYNYKIKSKKVINELISQYERIKFQFIELQKRQKNYEHNFQSKYAAAWELQKNEVNKYIEKLITANRIIHEEIFLKKFQDYNYKCLLEENINVNVDVAIPNEEKRKNPFPNNKVTDTQIEHVKTLLLQECAFLIDDNRQNETDEEKLKQIFKYIGVHNQKNLELLTQLFYIEEVDNKEEEEIEDVNNDYDNSDDNSDDDSDNDEDEDVEDNENRKISKKKLMERTKSLCVSPEYTLDIISKYCKEKEKEILYNINKGNQSYTNRLNVSLKLTIERKKKEKEYWHRLSHIISEEMMEVWKTLYTFVQKYFDILKERTNVIENIQKEEKQAKEYIKIINQFKNLEKKENL